MLFGALSLAAVAFSPPALDSRVELLDRERLSHELLLRGHFEASHEATAAETTLRKPTSSSQDEPVQLIIDTDLGFDVDDVGAVAVANHLQDIGRCKLVAVVHNTGFKKGIGGVDVVNHYYGRTNVELGAYKGVWGASSDAQNAQNRYTSTIQSRYPSPIKTYDDVSVGYQTYQKVLSEAADSSIVIASIGELTNLRMLLEKNASLFNRKVKEVHYMDGGYNFGCGDAKGSDWSPWLGSTNGCAGAAKYVVNNVAHNVAQHFSLNGGEVLTGSRFQDGCGAGPVKDAYQIWTGKGSRPSWDLITTYMAVMGVRSLHSYDNLGTMSVDSGGGEKFDTSSAAKHSNESQVWIDSGKAGDVTRLLDDIICSSPCRSDTDVGGCANYVMHAGHNCYGDRDGKGSHGASDLEDPPSSSCGKMTLAACLAKCDSTTGCDAVTVTPSDSGLVECYRKGNVDISKCDYGSAWGFDTWLKASR